MNTLKMPKKNLPIGLWKIDRTLYDLERKNIRNWIMKVQMTILIFGISINKLLIVV